MPLPDEVFTEVSAAGRTFLQSLLRREPCSRATASEALRHVWLAEEQAACRTKRAALLAPSRLRELRQQPGRFAELWNCTGKYFGDPADDLPSLPLPPKLLPQPVLSPARLRTASLLAEGVAQTGSLRDAIMSYQSVEKMRDDTTPGSLTVQRAPTTSEALVRAPMCTESPESNGGASQASGEGQCACSSVPPRVGRRGARKREDVHDGSTCPSGAGVGGETSSCSSASRSLPGGQDVSVSPMKRPRSISSGLFSLEFF